MNFVTQLLLVALVSFLLSQGEAFPAQLPRDLGFNKFDLPTQYLGQASGGNGQGNWLRTTRAMGEKAISDAQYFRAGFLRVSMTGFAPEAAGLPGDLDLWLKDPNLYWKAIDRMMADLERQGLKLVPVFVWKPAQFPAMVGETVSDLLTRPQSQSRNLLERYVREFVTRYRARAVIAFYELSNELNNGADLDMVKRCKQESGDAAPECLVRSNYTTNQMNEFTEWLAGVIRTVDPGRSISSGFSVPRPIASGLRVTPEWVTGNVNRPLDTPADLEKHLLDVHRAVSIISVHIYSVPQNRRFGGNEEALLERLDGIARRAGKPLYLGEFGNPGEDLPGNFVERMLAAVERIGVQWASPWIFEFYQHKPYLVSGSKADVYNLEPGYTPRTLAFFRETSCRISSNRCRLPLPATPPRVVLTWPIGCSKVGQIVEVFAVASENADYTGPVSFGIGDLAAVQVDRPPYRAEIPIPGGSSVGARVFARSCNVVGCSEDSVPVNRPASECAVTY